MADCRTHAPAAATKATEQQPFRAGCCHPRTTGAFLRPQHCLLAHFAESVAKYQRGEVAHDPQRRFLDHNGDPLVEMTCEGLWRFWYRYPHAQYPGAEAEFPVSLLQFRELFRALRIKLTVLDSQAAC